MHRRQWTALVAAIVVGGGVATHAWYCIQPAPLISKDSSRVCLTDQLTEIVGQPQERAELSDFELLRFVTNDHPLMTLADWDAARGRGLEILFWRKRCLGVIACEALALNDPRSGQLLMFSRWNRWYEVGWFGSGPPTRMSEHEAHCSTSRSSSSD
jgi:hypothetical protein